MADTYDCAAEAEADRAQQWQLLAALGAWRRALRRDTCNAWCIRGAEGHIYTWGDGKTWALWVHCQSRRHWTATKKRLAFCDLMQDCDEEGCLRLRRLPTLAQATVIREVLGIRKRAELSPEELERRRAIGKRLARGAGRAKKVVAGRGTSENASRLNLATTARQPLPLPSPTLPAT
jgi:hypothetical protein